MQSFYYSICVLFGRELGISNRCTPNLKIDAEKSTLCIKISQGLVLHSFGSVFYSYDTSVTWFSTSDFLFKDFNSTSCYTWSSLAKDENKFNNFNRGSRVSSERSTIPSLSNSSKVFPQCWLHSNQESFTTIHFFADQFLIFWENRFWASWHWSVELTSSQKALPDLSGTTIELLLGRSSGSRLVICGTLSRWRSSHDWIKKFGLIMSWCNVLVNMSLSWAVLVAQMVERLLPTPEVRCLNPNISKVSSTHCNKIETPLINKKEAMNGPSLKKPWVFLHVRILLFEPKLHNSGLSFLERHWYK